MAKIDYQSSGCPSSPGHVIMIWALGGLAFAYSSCSTPWSCVCKLQCSLLASHKQSQKGNQQGKLFKLLRWVFHLHACPPQAPLCSCHTSPTCIPSLTLQQPPQVPVSSCHALLPIAHLWASSHPGAATPNQVQKQFPERNKAGYILSSN